MPSVLVALQRMLDVARNGAVDVLVGASLRCERGLLVVVAAAQTHSATVAQVFVHALNTEHLLELAIRYERRTQQRASVVKLLTFRENETEGIGAREHQVHTARREHIGEQSGALDEIGEQRHLVDKYRAIAPLGKLAEVAIDLGQRIERGHLHERRTRKLVGGKVENRLTNEGGLPRATKPAQHEHLIAGLPL